MKKIFLCVLIVNFAFSIKGTITFYDGTTLDGELSSSDVRHVFITPEGLVMPEKIPVVDIDNFKLDNGIIMIDDGIAQQTYLDGKFSIIERDDEKEEYSSSEAEEYEEVILSPNEYIRLTVPPGIWFGFKGLGKPVNLISNIADIEHDPSEVERNFHQEVFQSALLL